MGAMASTGFPANTFSLQPVLLPANIPFSNATRQEQMCMSFTNLANQESVAGRGEGLAGRSSLALAPTHCALTRISQPGGRLARP
jgi:hypothetical protein